MKIGSVSDKYFIAFYKRVCKRKKRVIRDGKELLALQRIIFETIADLYVKNDAGVYVRGIGYLCHMMKKNFDFSIKMGMILNESRNGMGYYHMALEFPEKSTKYVHFGLAEYLYEKVMSEALKGKPYRFMYREVKEYIRKGNRYFQPRGMDLTKLNCTKQDI